MEEDLYVLNLLSKTRLTMKRSTLSRIPLEMILVKLAKRDTLVDLEALVGRLEELEERIGSAKAENPSSSAAPPQKPTSEENREAGSLSFGRIEEVWDSLVKKIESKKKSVGIFFREGRLIAFQEGRITVGFHPKNNFHREALESEASRKLIEETLSETLKQKIHITFEKLKEEKENPPQKKAFPEDPIVKLSLDVFKGDVVENE